MINKKGDVTAMEWLVAIAIIVFAVIIFGLFVIFIASEKKMSFASDNTIDIQASIGSNAVLQQSFLGFLQGRFKNSLGEGDINYLVASGAPDSADSFNAAASRFLSSIDALDASVTLSSPYGNFEAVKTSGCTAGSSTYNSEVYYPKFNVSFCARLK